MTMHPAPHRGETLLLLDGVPHRLCFDYDALDRVIAAFGEEWEKAVQRVLGTMQPADLCTLAAIGLQRFHPEITSTRMRELSPPIVPLAGSIAQALRLATIGPNPPAEDGPEGERKGQQKRGLLTRLGTLLRWHNGWASLPPNSGG